MLFQNWTGSKPGIVLAKEQLVEVDIFSYLLSCISSGSRITHEVPSRVQMARLVFANLRNL